MSEKKYPHARYDTMVEATFKRIVELGVKKGGEYAGDDDRLANFRRNAERMGVPMELIWGVYAAKHWDAVMQFVNDTVNGKSRERMEPIEGRIDDLIVYLLLFKAILDERNKDKEGTVSIRPKGVPDLVGSREMGEPDFPLGFPRRAAPPELEAHPAMTYRP